MFLFVRMPSMSSTVFCLCDSDSGNIVRKLSSCTSRAYPPSLRVGGGNGIVVVIVRVFVIPVVRDFRKQHQYAVSMLGSFLL